MNSIFRWGISEINDNINMLGFATKIPNPSWRLWMAKLWPVNQEDNKWLSKMVKVIIFATEWWQEGLPLLEPVHYSQGLDSLVSNTIQTLTIFIAIYCWPTISTFLGISLCCCCVSLNKVKNILLVLCWCQWKRASLYCYCLVHIDPYIVEHIGDNLYGLWTFWVLS